MDYLHRDRPSRAPPPTPGVARRQVSFVPAVAPARPEWFVAGSETAVVEWLAPARRAPKIVYPLDTTVIALDPDIPAPLQRMRFRAQGAQGLTWELDGAALGAADSAGGGDGTGAAGGAAAWTPAPGAHALKLVGTDGRTVAAVRFEVRGAPR